MVDTNLFGMQRCRNPSLDYEYQSYQTVAYIVEIPFAIYYDNSFRSILEKKSRCLNVIKIQVKLYL